MPAKWVLSKKKMLQPEIRSVSAAEAAAFFSTIPEFRDSYPPAEYIKRLADSPHLILLAYVEGEVAGGKVGYGLESDCFYSWMGAVRPHWRRHGIAELLAVRQEQWAREQGFSRIRFKTRNSCRAMLQFALSRGFNIIGVETKELVPEYRIWLEKSLLEEE
jgi:GNAT superfamily N-acetyltransferase